ncbi:Gfo/Idh/MocA family protein [Acidocella sp. KAb 2-4]|uniref:Gfo/Idh/MocA family protein n=1 Tax=Acidocella sp. KAb 2-4 TaxID=2885158 RepID=UPI001D08B7B1|nr:Gfo/Idh/MocA family oxidoreductase [Acidocella sp. KAb 2-4]MCB5945646.1 Gfo/Idh/MocA family oxidoreductase [Acidocella sp. KAb 2-4]
MAIQKIRVGIIGVQPDRSWAALAHIPALRAMPEQYDITAISTTRQESANAAATHYGIPRGYGHHAPLVNAPDVDLVAVTVKVPHHYEIVKAALEAGKMVYCEWPLGNGLPEAEELAALAKAKDVRTVVGLQAQFAPPLAYARDLVEQGYVGEVLSASVIGTGMNWGECVDAPNAYTADRKNGATMLTIPVSHTVDGVCSMLGEIRAVSALLVNRRHSTILADTGEALALTAEDQVAFVATLQGGAVLTAHYRGGMTKGTGLLLEINGTRGDLRLTSIGGHAQIFDMELSGAAAGQEEMQKLQVPAKYYHTALHTGPAVNVAEVYAQLARDVRDGTCICPDFHHAVLRHRMVEAIERASETGQRQSL